MKLIIPTFNRSAKLVRTLECYCLGDYNIRNIVVLDGSNNEHRIINEENCNRLGFEYLSYNPILDFNERLHSYLTSKCSAELVCLGTDEDVFCSSYISESEKFLSENTDYSSFIGRYITLGTPLLGLTRLIYARDHITSLDLSHDDPTRRLLALMNAILVGCSPLHWSVKRRSQLIKILESQKEIKLNYGGTNEMINQVYLSLISKIKFVKEPMLLRDETNIGYKATEDRHIPNIFEALLDFKKLKNKVLADFNIKNLEFALNLLEDRLTPLDTNIPDSQSLSLARHSRYYSAYEDFDGQNILFGKIVRVIAKIGLVISEVIAWQFAYRQLKLIVGRKVINKFCKSIPTHALFK